MALSTRLIIILMLACAAFGASLPNDAPRYIGVLQVEILRFWPQLDMPSMLGALVEQESLWKLRATLRTSRELGCGFGQFTKAYNRDGSVRFDALTETRRLDPSLAGWNWRDCYNAQYQLRAVVLKARQADQQCTAMMADSWQSHACGLAAYNGGFGGVVKRIRLCRAQASCDSRRWFGHLDRQCAASRTRQAGYGESFCEINSRYPYRVLVQRRPRYLFMDKPT